MKELVKFKNIKEGNSFMAPIATLITEIESDFDYSKWDECENTIDDASSCPDCCSKRYFTGGAIDYKCNQFQKAYVMRYLPVHIHENYLAFNKTPSDILARIGENKKVRLLSLGGGPGSDVAAFKKFVKEGNLDDMKTTELEIVRVDREENWNGLAKKVINLFKCKQFETSHLKIHADVTSDFNDDNSKYHFISLSYILSEISTENIGKLAKNIIASTDNVSVIVINDRNEDVVREKAELLLKEIGASKIKVCSDKNHCGVFYDDTVKDRIKPKLSTTSIRYNAMISQ